VPRYPPSGDDLSMAKCARCGQPIKGAKAYGKGGPFHLWCAAPDLNPQIASLIVDRPKLPAKKPLQHTAVWRDENSGVPFVGYRWYFPVRALPYATESGKAFHDRIIQLKRGDPCALDLFEKQIADVWTTILGSPDGVVAVPPHDATRLAKSSGVDGTSDRSRRMRRVRARPILGNDRTAIASRAMSCSASFRPMSLKA